MAIKLKSEQEISYMREAGLMVRAAMKEIEVILAPGITTQDIEDVAQSVITGMGGKGSFNTVPGYSWFTCTPINNQITHTPPSNRQKIADGDVVTVDIGAQVEGMHVDHANTWRIGTHDDEVARFLEIGQKTLQNGLSQAKVGNYIGDISRAMQKGIEEAGYNVIYQLVGHGVGYSVHEDPIVPNYLDREIRKTPRIESGLTIAVEILYSMGTSKMKHEAGSDWSIVTADGSIAAQFEHTVACVAGKTEILT